MGNGYGCICCAVPKSLLKHLVQLSSGPDRQLLHAQMEHSSKLRGQRAAQSRELPAPRPGRQLLHRQVFDAQGQTLLPGKLLRDEDDPPTPDKQGDQAYEHIGIAMRFYQSVLGRDSVDGRGMRIDASVHYGFRFINAMWTGEQMIVGDGDGRHVTGLAHSLGIIAHELSHGITQHLVKGGLGIVNVPGQGPVLKGEAGALNESFADVFASMIKQWHAGLEVQDADWLLGEDILAPHAGKAIRSLKDPGNREKTWPKDDQIKDFRSYKPTDEAHKASGIANHAFYLAATDLRGKSWEKLAAIWLKAYGRLRARATFRDAAHATMDVAAELHGKGSASHEAIKAAWKEVKVLA